MKQVTILATTDTETTGATDKDQVCELAIVLSTVMENDTGRLVYRTTPEYRWSSLVKPTVPVSPEGRAAHHIPDIVLDRCQTMPQMLKSRGLPEYGRRPEQEEEVVFVAHNLEFDWRLMIQSGVPEDLMPKRKICTYKCAKHLWPQAPRHSNQVLRYWLSLDVPMIRGLPPHRALPDAVVTQALVERMLETHSVDQLVELTTTPVLMEICTMGTWAGKPWEMVDVGMLRWIIGKGERRPNPKGGRDIGFDVDTLYTAKHWLDKKTGATA